MRHALGASMAVVCVLATSVKFKQGWVRTPASFIALQTRPQTVSQPIDFETLRVEFFMTSGALKGISNEVGVLHGDLHCSPII